VKNTLFYGDNLDVMRRYIADETVDLVYLDPPFNSNADYNVLFAEHSGDRAAAQIKAFEDTWTWDAEAARSFEGIVEGGGLLSETMQALRQMLGGSNMLAYLAMMAPRLLELHRVLRPIGSLFLHCDSTASHYLKLILDAIFAPLNFRNEIVWRRATPKGHNTVRFSRAHDVILFYGKSPESPFKTLYGDLTEEYKESHYSSIEPVTGRRYQLTSLINPNANRPNLTYEFPPGSGTVRVWRWTRERMMEAYASGQVVVPPGGGVARFKRYLDVQLGMPLTDFWDDIPPINSQAQERLGYPTQKPEALLRRILSASAPPGSLVLDPFCGCGTTISVAQQMGLLWIGIDITHLAIGLIKHRLLSQFGAAISSTYQVVGEPVSLPDAESLAADEPFQFQAWALGLVGARTAQSAKKGADKGIDGNIYFHDDPQAKTKRIILSIKAGQNISVSMVRDLVGTITREGAVIGVLISMVSPTGPMLKEAASAGFYTSPMGGKHPKIQILTIEELLAGKGIDYPTRSQRADLTFRKARQIASDVQALPLSAFIAPDATMDPEDEEEAE